MEIDRGEEDENKHVRMIKKINDRTDNQISWKSNGCDVIRKALDIKN
jgi:hypothetical protein